jgi:hypothetical protein
VNGNPTTAVLTSDLNPSFNSQEVTLTATVSAENTPVSGPPSGGWVLFFDGDTFLAQRQVVNGVATLTTSALGVGEHFLIAEFLGDDVFEGSWSSSLVQTVNVNSTATTVTSSQPTSSFGDSVTFLIVVIPVGTPVTGPPGGWIILSDDGVDFAQVALDADATASYSTSSLSVGTHIIRARYLGDNTFDVSLSDPLTQTVQA